jgi:cytochrome c556
MRKLIFSLVVSAALAVPATAVVAHEPGTYESPIVEQRVKRFKQSGADIQAIFKKHIAAGNYEAIEQAALRMASWGRQMPDAFPEGSNSIGADPSIWEDFSDFKNKSDAFADAAMRLKAVAGSRQADAVKGAAQALGATCKSCHQSYRIKH